MNQKDYKEIAKIIVKNKPNIKTNVFENLPLMSVNLITDLADYFEKKDNELATVKDDICYESEVPSSINNQKEFNKEQFLKDCGVEK